MFYAHAVRTDVAIWLPGATLCRVSWLYCILSLMQLIVLITGGLTGLTNGAGDTATSDISTINTPPKLKALLASET